MDRLLTSFIRALRNADVRVSTAETLDALHAVQLVGYEDRALLKTSLSLVLPKTQTEKTVFDTTFDQFFALRQGAPLTTDDVQDEDDPETNSGDASQQGQGGGEGSSGSSEAAAEKADASVAPTALPDAQSPLGQLLMRGNQLEIDLAEDSREAGGFGILVRQLVHVGLEALELQRQLVGRRRGKHALDEAAGGVGGQCRSCADLIGLPGGALEERRVLGQGVRGDRGAEKAVGGDGRTAHGGLWFRVLEYGSHRRLRQESHDTPSGGCQGTAPALLPPS